jgi:hypothetical protein
MSYLVAACRQELSDRMGKDTADVELKAANIVKDIPKIKFID